MTGFRVTGASLVLAMAAVPALAQDKAEALLDALATGAIAIPEPGELALFMMGIAGLIIGRRASRKRPAPPERSDLDE